jgi:hypothetical protein
MEKMDKYRVLAGIVLFGSLWGMTECLLGEFAPAGFPAGAFLGAFIGLGLMLMTRRMFGFMWMQLGMAIVASALRFWAPVGTCVICSALAIMAEGLVFEMIFNRPAFNINRSPNMKSARTLAVLGVIAGFTIYVVGYMFTQIFTPILTTGTFSISNFVSVLPLIFGTGFFAAVFGGISAPLAVLAKQLYVNVMSIKKEHYYAAAAGISTFCWALVFAFFYI